MGRQEAYMNKLKHEAYCLEQLLTVQLNT